MKDPCTGQPGGLWRTASRLRSDDGMALAAVIIIGLAMVMISSIVVVRAFQSINLSDSDRNYEDSLFVAESGIDKALVELDDDYTYNTGEQMADLGTRDEIIAAAEARPATDIINTPEGEVVIVKPLDGNVVYAVGFTPSRDAVRRQERVLAAELEIGWKPEFAVTIGGDLKLEAKKDRKDVQLLPDDLQRVHANGKVELKDKHEDDVHGCLTGSGKGAGPGNKFSNNGTPDCPAADDVVDVVIPTIDPMNVHHLSQWDVCPDELLHYGPANMSVAEALRGTPGEPCSGAAAPTDNNLKDVDEWDKKVEFNKDTVEGVYFLWGRSAKVKKIKEDGPRWFTIIAAKPENILDCSWKDSTGEKIDKEQYGDIEVDVHGDIYAHPDGGGYFIVTAGDVKLKTKKKKDGEIHGAILLHEQFKIESEDIDMSEPETPKGGIQGVIVAESACDTKDSKMDKGRSEWKKGDMYLDEDFVTFDFLPEGGSFVRGAGRSEL